VTRPSDHYPRRCGCGHHAADPLDTITLGPGRVVPLDEVIRQILNDHPISLRDDLDALKAGLGIPDAAPTVEADTPTRAGIGAVGVTTPAPTAADLVTYINEHRTALALGWRTLLGYGMSATASVIADLLALAERVAR
jgi:hypothetical protein